MKCINCGKEVKKDNKFCAECGTYLKNIEIINEPEKKSNKGFIITLIILIIISLGISAAILVLNNKEEDKKKLEIVVDDKEVLFKNYKFRLLDGFTNIKNGSNKYIKTKEYIILYEEYPLNYKEIMNNKEILIQELQDQGYSIIKFDSKVINDENYIIITSKLDDIEYGLIFYEIDSDTNIYITITANYLARFNEKWFDEVINFLNTKEKI